ncbi:MerR family transcriptional regulator [Limnoraphis robusta Tam1]|uniref:MerR family transcriptional regulator n=1 Tax=Limnoraphis robusta CCNP1315 TaxID=3110306 RepID=A0ABU5TR47_9CYAN|nr:MerR family transcriptional regulator [Limnoraphis robusta]MEA5497938.1 MerR family transcriptional regulator [Limnoraphis robusta BA-68 BA1]MEA5517366.1 MerR family transcriptional regulator [Limnoraphis robusta CCNP1315]MEA5542956.1 MerR family transcriptional regulator [Limnoraphis robusta Tam1]MEA5546045.1 MerR family transcriptional regulator [Limnoraphis robusta CCNP1324]
MAEQFFTSKQAAEITGCSLRQLQYWREKGVVVPSISATGTGRSIYYSRSELVKLAAMEYCLSVGLSFEAAATTLKQLQEKQPEFTNPSSQERFMLWWDSKERSLHLVEFDMEKAIASLKSGQPVIPVWLDQIHQQVASKLVG